MDQSPRPHIVIGADGMVLAASGPVASDLVDRRLEDCAGVSRQVRAAGEALLHELHGSANRVVSRIVAADEAGASVELVAIEAMALRRTATDVASLLTSKLAVISFQAASVDVILTVEAHLDVPDRVHLDADKLGWAVTTLVGNALRYMRSGSRQLAGRAIALNVRGAGLALVLIADIVAAHGGRVEVRSRTDPADQGTTIRLTFPVA